MSKARKRRSAHRGRLAKVFKFVSISILVFFVAIIAALSIVVSTYLKEIPKISKESITEKAQTTKIYASDGTLLTNLFAEQNRIVIPLSEIPASMQNAAIAVEDERFYEHKGVDLKAIIRATFINLRSGKVVEGGSTITQQYVKNSYVSQEKTLSRKIKEAFLAYQLERTLSKKEILEKYLNTIYFGQSIYGIETAAQTYFGKHAKELTLAESATLAGLIKSPNYYSPYINPEKSKQARNSVLKKMLKQKLITKEESEKAMDAPLEAQPIKAPKAIAPYFVEYIKQSLIDKYGANMVFKGGLRVYTTIDLKMQKIAEDAVSSILNKPNDPSASMVSVDPRTGYIKAMVGGENFETKKFNLAVQGKRQAGSSFKVFVLAAAIETGISPSKVYQSSPLTIKLPGQDWEVHNYTEGSGGGPMSLREATIKSVNAVFARLIMEVGPKNVVDIAKKMGITSQVDPNPSIALGGLKYGVSSLEMASAYATLANGGIHHYPIGITKVTDSWNNTIEEYKTEEKEAINPLVAYTVTDILKDVINYGTGTKAKIGRPAAGKTGTAQNYQDAWFVGYVPELSTSVWVGHPEGQIPMTKVHGIRVAGGTFPAQIWGKYMKKVLEDTPVSDFPKPKTGIVKVKICKESNLLATRYCPEVKYETIIKGTGPKKYCNIHTTPREVLIPNVIGLPVKKATYTLQQAGFNVSQTTQPSADVAKGYVISQSPAGDTNAIQDTNVNIVVSIGSAGDKVTVPNLVGMTEEQAKQTLSNNGLSAAVQYITDANRNGKVVQQDPVSGTVVDSNSFVTITVAKL
ncbi:MAG: PBP1A family penicillin-binding protein [Actinobacteria bacterium]|nr:PBP1A family penicillin-binding protein [Actinomycetota bacterium]